jgi:hypothetical protein
VDPGRTMAPSTTSAILWMLVTRGWQHGCDVVNEDTSSLIRRSCASFVVISGSAAENLAFAMRPVVREAIDPSERAVAAGSKRWPSSPATTLATAPFTAKLALRGSFS